MSDPPPLPDEPQPEAFATAEAYWHAYADYLTEIHRRVHAWLTPEELERRRQVIEARMRRSEL